MTFVVTDGQLAALDRASTTTRLGVRITDRLNLSYSDIWRTQPQVRTVVGFLARNIAQINLHVFKRVADTDRERLTDHPMAQLISRPNPRTTRYRFMDALVSDLGIHDNAILLKAAIVGKQPRGLIRLDPARVSPIGDNALWADGYRYKGSKGYRDLDPAEVVHFRGFNPEDSRWGISPLETLRRILAEEYEAGQWREQLWRNGARVPGFISRPKDAKDWSDPARDRFKTDFKGLYTGDGPGAGGTPVLEDGMTFTASGITPEQAEYLAARKLTREEVAAAFHIPLPMVGILDHATFSNIKEQHQQLYQDTLGPWLEMIAEELMLQLLPDLDASPDVYLEFNLAEKMRGSFEEQASTLQTAVGGPWMLRNEARARVNLPAIEGGDELIVPLNVTSGGQASPTDSAPKARVEQLARDYTKRQIRVLSTGQQLDPNRWSSELTNDVLTLMEGKSC